MSGWNVTDEIREKFSPVLRKYFDKVENLTAEQAEGLSNEELGLILSDQGISPAQLVDLLEEFGYKESRRDDNGWELDFWIEMERADGKKFPSTCEHLVVAGSGMTFELKVYIEGMDF